jgi:hypothetical protein
MQFWIYAIVKLGGMGEISLKLKNVSMDLDNDGVVTEDEFENNMDLQKELIENSLTLLGTLGVVGALIFSVLYSTVLSPLIASEESSNYFSEYQITAFSYVYYICVYLALTRSFTTIFQSVILYLKLSTWMPNVEMKMWFIARKSLTPVVNNAMFCLISSSIAIPFGIAVNVSPGAALIALVLEVCC